MLPFHIPIAFVDTRHIMEDISYIFGRLFLYMSTSQISCFNFMLCRILLSLGLLLLVLFAIVVVVGHILESMYTTMIDAKSSLFLSFISWSQLPQSSQAGLGILQDLCSHQREPSVGLELSLVIRMLYLSRKLMGQWGILPLISCNFDRLVQSKSSIPHSSSSSINYYSDATGFKIHFNRCYNRRTTVYFKHILYCCVCGDLMRVVLDILEILNIYSNVVTIACHQLITVA